MCVSPLGIKNNSVYQTSLYTPHYLTVPCGKCEDCRNIQQTEWRTRILFDIFDTYKNGGIGLFLTLTYNNDNLPYFVCPYLPKLDSLDKTLSYFEKVEIKDKIFEDDEFYWDLMEYPELFDDTNLYSDLPCFNKDHCLKFLNNLKVNIYKLFGKGHYKYVLVSEFGENTKRPHYHLLLLLDSFISSHWSEITELVRSLWSYGFMFPKCVNGYYVDDCGQPNPPYLRDKVYSATYVSKYICKDMSFFGQDFFNMLVHDYMPYFKKIAVLENFAKGSSRYSFIRNQFPFHLQSNGIGSSLVDLCSKMSEKQLIDALNNGLFPPQFQRNKKPVRFLLPSYVCNRLLYKNVPSGRCSVWTSKQLYDRYLTDFGKQFMLIRLHARQERYKAKVVNWTMSSSKIDMWCKRFGLSPFSSLLYKVRCRYPDYLDLLAKYHFVVKNYAFGYFDFLDRLGMDYFDTVAVDDYFVHMCNTEYKKNNFGPLLNSYEFSNDISFEKLSLIDKLHSSLCGLMFSFRSMQLDAFNSQQKINDKVRYELLYKYNKSLC